MASYSATKKRIWPEPEVKQEQEKTAKPDKKPEKRKKANKPETKVIVVEDQEPLQREQTPEQTPEPHSGRCAYAVSMEGGVANLAPIRAKCRGAPRGRTGGWKPWGWRTRKARGRGGVGSSTA
jgi:hypothetical protein